MSDTLNTSAKAASVEATTSSAEGRRSVKYLAKDAARPGAAISRMRLPFGEAIGPFSPFFDIRIMDGRRVREKYTDLLPSEMRKILGTQTGDAVMVDAIAKLEASADPNVEGRMPLGHDNELRMAIGGAQANEQVLPPAALRAFVQKGNEFFYAATPERLAFVDNGTTLRTSENSAAVATALVSISVARGWESITVAGSEDFRRLVWTEAARQGVEVLGFSPTPDDVLKAKIGGDSAQAAAQRAQSDDRSSASMARPASPTSARSSRTGRGNLEERYTGELLAHGRAHYKNDPKEAMSYFATLETVHGRVEHWGRGVEAAIAAAGAQLGDTIHLHKAAAHPVQAPVTVHDASGQVTGQKWAAARRNEWTASVLVTAGPGTAQQGRTPASNMDRSSERRSQAAEGIRKADPSTQERFPDLAGGAVALVNTIQQTAQRELKGSQPIAVAKVVQATRRILANQLEQGADFDLERGKTRQENRQRRQDPVLR